MSEIVNLELGKILADLDRSDGRDLNPSMLLVNVGDSLREADYYLEQIAVGLESGKITVVIKVPTCLDNEVGWNLRRISREKYGLIEAAMRENSLGDLIKSWIMRRPVPTYRWFLLQRSVES